MVTVPDLEVVEAYLIHDKMLPAALFAQNRLLYKIMMGSISDCRRFILIEFA